MQVIYTVCGDEDEAQTIAETVVSESLAACANMWTIDSVYRWKGQVQRGDEVAVLIKTKVANVQAVFDRVKELHSYDTPAIFVLPTGVVEEDYLDFVQQVC